MYNLDIYYVGCTTQYFSVQQIFLEFITAFKLTEEEPEKSYT